VLLAGLVSARAKESGVAPRFLATRDEIEALVRWWLEGERSREPDLPVLAGWRRELAGGALLAWLSGETTIAIDEASDAGIKLAET
jgi:ribonuclease D